MTARTVSGTVEFPSGNGAPLVGARVSAELYTGTDGNLAYGAAGDVAVNSTATLTDNAGAWTLQLEPNIGITPAGTVWRVKVAAPTGRGFLVDEYISVPDTAGTLMFTDLLAEQPGALPSQALTAHAAEINAHDTGVFDPRDFGTLDASGDNRAAFQAAINAADTAGGGTVWVPAGTWPVGKSASGSYCLAACSNLTVTGPGTIVQASGIATSTRLFYLDGVSRFTAKGLRLDGNSGAQSVNEHRHGFFVTDSTGVRIEDCDIYGFTGDGVYLFDGCADVWVAGCRIHDCDRNGVSNCPSAGANSGLHVVNNHIYDCVSTAVDHEPTGGYASDVAIIGNNLDCPTSVSFSGTVNVAMSERCVIQGNRCNGRVTLTWGGSIRVVGNTIDAGVASGYPLVACNYQCRDVFISGNELVASSAISEAVVYVVASGSPIQWPDRIVVSGNVIHADGQIGCRIQGCPSSVVSDNLILFAENEAGAIGVYVKPTLDMESVVISGNTIASAASPILFEPSDTNTIALASITGNVIDDRGTSTTYGVRFSGSTRFVDRAYIAGNLVGAAVGTAVSGTSNIGELI